MVAPDGTMDHLVPWRNIRGTPEEPLAYAWDNLRFCSGLVNSSKRVEEWPDPYLVEDDWFELILPGLELVSTAAVPLEHRASVARALRLLGRDRRILKQREAWYNRYQEGKLSLTGLREIAPLIARALERHPDRLRAEDRGHTLTP